jgi:uncharacterized membrane protein YhiD involved in acid resistance
MDEFLTIFGPARVLGAGQIIVSFLASFVLCSMIAYVYRLTYEGLSYSRAFVQTLILSGVISGVLIMAIGNNLARGLGILGTLAIIRFRTHIRDPRDIVFLFASLSIGISCGASVFSVAVIGAVGYCLVVLFLHYAPFASRRDYEGLVRFTLPAGETVSPDIQRVIEQFCLTCQLIAVRDAVQGEGQEFAYQVRLRDPSHQADLIAGLKGLARVSNVNLLMQRTTVEL